VQAQNLGSQLRPSFVAAKVVAGDERRSMTKDVAGGARDDATKPRRPCAGWPPSVYLESPTKANPEASASHDAGSRLAPTRCRMFGLRRSRARPIGFESLAHVTA
jgi:hypothetical protein